MKTTLDLTTIKQEFANCECGQAHPLTLKCVKAESGVVHQVGQILTDQAFPKRLLLVADQQTLRASEGIRESLAGYAVKEIIYDNFRQAELKESKRIQAQAEDTEAILAVGTGSIHDVCRYAASQANLPLCLFATAPSMDGFASYNAALTDGSFKETYAAKTPEIILADTQILARSPKELKAAGFGDMVAKYVALIDWQVSHLLVNEMYCPKVASLTRKAVDRLMAMSHQIQEENEQSAKAVFEGLLLTGIAMGFTKTSRPASGTEHILSHFWECMKLLEGQLSDYHGKKVGVATLLIMDVYERLMAYESVDTFPEKVDWNEIYQAYGPLSDQVRRLNSPETITNRIDPERLKAAWPKIREIIRSVPSAAVIRKAMTEAGCALKAEDIGISDHLRDLGMTVHPYMRNRLSLYRLRNMLAEKTSR